MHAHKTSRPWQPELATLLPPSPREWLSEDHQVYFLLRLVDELDLSAILVPGQVKDPRGEKGFGPRMQGKPSEQRVDERLLYRLSGGLFLVFGLAALMQALG